MPRVNDSCTPTIPVRIVGATRMVVSRAQPRPARNQLATTSSECPENAAITLVLHQSNRQTVQFQAACVLAIPRASLDAQRSMAPRNVSVLQDTKRETMFVETSMNAGSLQIFANLATTGLSASILLEDTNVSSSRVHMRSITINQIARSVAVRVVAQPSVGRTKRE